MSKMITIHGTDGYDHLEGTTEDETFLAYSGNDLIREIPSGGPLASDDVFYGMQGNDQLLSYNGSDALFGGKGNDEFVIAWRDAEIKAAGGDGHDSLIIIGLTEADAQIDDRDDKTIITDDDGSRLVLRGIEDFDFAA